MRFIHTRSAPAENDLPAPESTTTRIASSASMERNASVISAMSASSNALWRSGRFMVMSPSGPWPSIASDCVTPLPSHAEDAKTRLLGRCIHGRGERHAQHAAGVGRVYDPVIPEARGGVVRMALLLVLLADRALERLLLVLRPLPALRLDAIAAHRGEHRGGLLATHHRDARVGPGPDEARAEGAPAHAVVAGAERAAEDHRELAHARARHRRDHLRPVLRDALRLVFAPDHEAGDVLQEEEGDAALRAQLDAVRALERRFGEEDAVVGDDSHRKAVQLRESGHQRGSVERLEFMEVRSVDEARDDLADVERLLGILRNDAVEVLGGIERFGCHPGGGRSPIIGCRRSTG